MGAGVSGAPDRERTAQPGLVIDLLNRYSSGDGEAVAASLTDAPGLGALGKDLERIGRSWIDARGAREAPRRRLVTATLALEVAKAGRDSDWTTLRRLVEFGCGLVRRDPPGSEAERLWLLASVALAHGARDRVLLDDHLSHAQARFPDEPRFRLAAAIAYEQRAPHEADRDEAWHGRDELLAMSRAGDRSAPAALLAWAAVSAAIGQFEALVDVAAVRAEANLRAGYLWFVLREHDKARARFSLALEASPDPAVRYLAHFLTGRALEAEAKPRDAEIAYRQAVDVLPHAQSATSALAARLFFDKRPDEAYALVHASFAAHPRPADPWRLYGYGDFRFWPDLIARLRQVLK